MLTWWPKRCGVQRGCVWCRVFLQATSEVPVRNNTQWVEYLVIVEALRAVMNRNGLRPSARCGSDADDWGGHLGSAGPHPVLIREHAHRTRHIGHSDCFLTLKITNVVTRTHIPYPQHAHLPLCVPLKARQPTPKMRHPPTCFIPKSRPRFPNTSNAVCMCTIRTTVPTIASPVSQPNSRDDLANIVCTMRVTLLCTR